MNLPQRLVVIVAALSCTVLTLYAPYEYNLGQNLEFDTSSMPADVQEAFKGGVGVSFGNQRARSRGWVFNPPHANPNQGETVRGFNHEVQLPTLAMNWALVIFPAAALFALLARNPGRGASDTAA
jgi:hypothetical protein